MIKTKFADVPCAFVKTDEEAIRRVRHSVKAILVTSGADGASIIPKYQNGLENVANLSSIIVFTSKHNLSNFQSQFNKYEKVKSVSDNMLDVLVSIEECILEASKAKKIETMR